MDKPLSANIIWKKKYTTKERRTIVNEIFNDREAMELFIKMKGNFDKITFISIQIFDRGNEVPSSNIILADDKDGIIYQMKEEWKLSQEESSIKEDE